MGRKELREHIFKLLFQIEFNEAEELPGQIEYYIDSLDAAEKDKEYIRNKCGAVMEHLEEIDQIADAYGRSRNFSLYLCNNGVRSDGGRNDLFQSRRVC